ncbi:hypothetical protein ABIF33_009160 [Bradyrhizobium elkanii]
MDRVRRRRLRSAASAPLWLFSHFERASLPVAIEVKIENQPNRFSFDGVRIELILNLPAAVDEAMRPTSRAVEAHHVVAALEFDNPYRLVDKRFADEDELDI